MQNYLIKSVLALFCLTLVLVPVPVKAQSSDIGLTVTLSPATTIPGGTVAVYALVTNSSTSRIRTTVTLSSLSPCGIETSLGYHKLVLNPGASIYVTAGYKLLPDACLGLHAVTATVGGGGKTGAASPSTTAYLTVQ